MYLCRVHFFSLSCACLRCYINFDTYFLLSLQFWHFRLSRCVHIIFRILFFLSCFSYFSHIVYVSCYHVVSSIARSIYHTNQATTPPKKKIKELNEKKKNKNWYLNAFLMMWAHWINRGFMTLKSVLLITTNSIPHLHNI